MDTRNKRASVLGFALASLLVLPAPDGTIAAADRQHVAVSYAGELTAGVDIGDVLEATVVSRMPARSIVSRLPSREVVGFAHTVASRMPARSVVSRLSARTVRHTS
jgi:hypothetical protein